MALTQEQQQAFQQQINQIKQQAQAIASQVNTFAQAKQAGMTITPSTTTKQAAQYLSSIPSQKSSSTSSTQNTAQSGSTSQPSLDITA